MFIDLFWTEAWAVPERRYLKKIPLKPVVLLSWRFHARIYCCRRFELLGTQEKLALYDTEGPQSGHFLCQPRHMDSLNH